MRPITILCVSCLTVAMCLLATCGFTGGGGGGAASDTSHAIAGTFVDVHTGAEVSVSSLALSGLTGVDAPVFADSSFSLGDVPEDSSFQLRATAPLYRPTFSQTITVDDSDLHDLVIPLASESFLADLAAAFAVTPNPQRGVLLARVVDGDGKPRSGVAAGNFVLNTGAMNAPIPPMFLNDNMIAAPTAVTTSASGWVVFFDVPAGVSSLTQSATSTITLAMATSPIEAGAVTVAEILFTNSEPPMFRDVSFRRQIVPIFTTRGCVACHTKGQSGDKIGGLNLSGAADKVFKELFELPRRVVIGVPEQSLILTKPSRESPPDGHPNVSFASAADVDFQKLYVWIKEGAKMN